MALSAGSEFQKGNSSPSEAQCSEQRANEDASRLCDEQPSQAEILAEGFPDIALEDIPLPPSPFPLPAASNHSSGNESQPNKIEMQTLQSSDEVSKVSLDQRRVALTDGIVEGTKPSIDISILNLERNSPVESSLVNCEEPKILSSAADVATTSVQISALSQLEPDSGKELALLSETVGKPDHPSDAEPIPPKGKKPYLCTECRRRFAERDDLLQHLYDHIAEFTGKHPFRCPKCPGRRFPDMKQHERHHQMGLECDICGEAFHAAIVIAEHRLRVHSRKKTISCKVCGKKYATSEELTQHQQKRHRKSKPYICKTCGKGFRSKESLSTHKQAHSEEQPASSSSRSSQHVKKSKEKADTSTTMESKKLSCSKCGMDFSCKEKLTEHKKNAHISQQEKKSQAGTTAASKQYKCKSCKMDFLTIGNLIEHQQLVHTSQQETIPETVASNLKQYKCKKCAKDFTTRRKLKEHNISVHISQQKRDPQVELSVDCKLFKCEKCAIDFPTEEKLNEHSMSVHVDLQEKYPQPSTLFDYIPYKDDVADMVVTSKEYINEIDLSVNQSTLAIEEEKHIPATAFSSHKPHKCEECGLDFTTDEKLSEHNMSSHIAEQEKSPLGGADSDYEPYNGGSDRDFSDDDQLYDPSMPSYTSPQEESLRTCSFFDYKPHKCEECCIDFSSEEELGEHNLSAHDAKQEKSSQLAASDYIPYTSKAIETNLSPQEKLSHNNDCGMYFSTKEKLHEPKVPTHVGEHENDPQTRKLSLNDPFRSEMSKTYFSTKKQIDEPNNSEGPNEHDQLPQFSPFLDHKPYKCVECGVDFRTEERLNEHSVTAHKYQNQIDAQTEVDSDDEPFKIEVSKSYFSVEDQFHSPKISKDIGQQKENQKTEPDFDDEPFKIEVSKTYFFSNEKFDEPNSPTPTNQPDQVPQFPWFLDHETFIHLLAKVRPSGEEWQYQCEDCGINFSTKDTLNDHKISVHSTQEEEARIKRKSSDNGSHHEASDMEFSDEEEGDTPATYQSEENHLQTCPLPDIESFRCEECESVFSSEEKLDDHKISHIDQVNKDVLTGTSSVHDPYIVEASEMDCAPKILLQELTVSAHVNQQIIDPLSPSDNPSCEVIETSSSTKEKLSELNEVAPSSQLQMNQQLGAPSDYKPFIWKAVEMYFSSKEKLNECNKAALTSQPENDLQTGASLNCKPAKCGISETNFTFKENSTEHGKVLHSGQPGNNSQIGSSSDYKPYIWKTVEMYFSNKDKINEHNMSTHMGRNESNPQTRAFSENRPIMSNESESNLSTNEKPCELSRSSHTVQPKENPPAGPSSEHGPFKAQGCEMDFAFKERLNYHSKSAHTSQEENLRACSSSNYRPFICEECGANFSQKQALRDHEMRHKPHKCLHFCVNCLNICDYSSATSAGLTDHMKKFHEVCFECKFSDKWS